MRLALFAFAAAAVATPTVRENRALNYQNGAAGNVIDACASKKVVQCLLAVSKLKKVALDSDVYAAGAKASSAWDVAKQQQVLFNYLPSDTFSVDPSFSLPPPSKKKNGRAAKLAGFACPLSPVLEFALNLFDTAVLENLIAVGLVKADTTMGTTGPATYDDIWVDAGSATNAAFAVRSFNVVFRAGSGPVQVQPSGRFDSSKCTPVGEWLRDEVVKSSEWLLPGGVPAGGSDFYKTALAAITKKTADAKKDADDTLEAGTSRLDGDLKEAKSRKSGYEYDKDLFAGDLARCNADHKKKKEILSGKQSAAERTALLLKGKQDDLAAAKKKSADLDKKIEPKATPELINAHFKESYPTLAKFLDSPPKKKKTKNKFNAALAEVTHAEEMKVLQGALQLKKDKSNVAAKVKALEKDIKDLGTPQTQEGLELEITASYERCLAKKRIDRDTAHDVSIPVALARAKAGIAVFSTRIAELEAERKSLVDAGAINELDDADPAIEASNLKERSKWLGELQLGADKGAKPAGASACAELSKQIKAGFADYIAPVVGKYEVAAFWGVQHTAALWSLVAACKDADVKALLALPALGSDAAFGRAVLRGEAVYAELVIGAAAGAKCKAACKAAAGTPGDPPACTCDA